MANLIKIDTTGYTSNYILLLDSPTSVGRYVTVKDAGTNPSFFSSNAIVISTTSGYRFFDGNSTEYIRTNKGSLSFLTTSSNWRLLNTVAYTTLGHAVLSTISTKNMSVFGNVSSFAQVTVQNTMQVDSIDTQNLATVNAVPVVTASNMTSTVAGLGTFAYLSSISFFNNYFASTVNGLGTYGIISSSLLTSSMQGLGPPYVSSSFLTSTMQGLGSLGYISYSQFNSSIIGITNGFRSNINSTVADLGTFGYISSQSLISSIRDLGQAPYMYISTKSLQSTTASITTFTAATIVSTVQGLGQIYISTQALVSTTVGISNVNASNIGSTINNLGPSYISSLSLQSTVAGLGTLGYISISQLTSTMTGLSNVTVAVNTSIDNLGTNQYISAPSLVSSIMGLGSSPYSYISGASLVSTVNGLGSLLVSTPSLLEKATSLLNSVYFTSPITSTMNGLGNYYLSTSGDATVVGRLGVSLAGINAITRAGNIPANRRVTTLASIFDPNGVVVDSTGVYVADTTSDRIILYTPAGAYTYVFLTNPFGLAMDATGNIYVTQPLNNGVWKIDPFKNQTSVANIVYPSGVAVNSSGTVYVTSYGTHQVFQIIGGTTTVLAGSGLNGYVDGNASTAQFFRPVGVAVDLADNIFIADAGNGAIRQIKESFIISLVQATTGVPRYMVMDVAGNIYYSIPIGNVIMKRDTAGNVTTYAGSGTAGLVDGLGTAASFYGPRGLAIDSAGNIYVADTLNKAVRIIYTSRNVATIFVSNIYQQELNSPQGVAVSSSVVYVADTGNSLICSFSPIANIIVSTFAGSGATGSADGTGTSASFNRPSGVVVDSAGTIYVADSTNHTIRKITPAGVVTTFAGSGAIGSADGTGLLASFNYPYGLAVDSAGNIYVADSENNKIRKITPAGVVTTLAGSGAPGSADGTGTSASFRTPTGVVVDSAGNIYVAELSNHKIRKITSAGVVTTFAGSGSPAYADGTGLLASFFFPYGVAVDSARNIYVADYGNARIRKITPAGVVTTLAGSGAVGSADGTGATASFERPRGVAIDSAGNIYVADLFNNKIRKITANSPLTIIAGQTRVTTLAGSGSPAYADGAGLLASFNYPYGVAVNSAGTIYVADSQNCTIRQITSAGVVTTLAGTGLGGSTDGTGVNASFNVTYGVAVNSAGTIYVADTGSCKIRQITPAGVVTTLAGSGFLGYADGTGATASFNNPSGVAVDSAGNIYVADAGNHKIRKITPAGVVTTFAGSGAIGSADGTGASASFNYPYGVAVDSAGNIYVADTYNHKIRQITPAGVVTTLAGSVQGSADGTGASASFNYPTGVAVDSAANIYVADVNNHKIRKITPTGVVTTLAGSVQGSANGSANGTGLLASFNYPTGVALDSAGNIYVADWYNHKIRKIINTNSSYSDGNGTSAKFNGPTGIRLDASGNIYVADTGNNMIRKIDPSANVTTIAGNINSGFANGVGTAAKFNGPTDVTFDASGNIYVADSINHVIRKIDSTQNVTTYIGTAGVAGNSLTVPGLFSGPIGVFVSGSYIYVTDSVNSAIKRIIEARVVSTVASGLVNPTAIAFDYAGTMYVTDGNRVITIPNSTYAGTGSAGSADGIWSSATFNSLCGIAIDSAGIVYVADRGNSLLRKIAPSSTNNTLFYANSNDIWQLTSPATSSLLTSTTNLNGGLAYDGTTIYATRDNSIYAYNTVTTAAYTLVGSSAGYANGTSGVTFNQPKALAIDSSGKNLYVCDVANSAIRKVQISPISVTTVASITFPTAIAIDSYSRYAYVTNFNSVGSVYRVSLLQGNTTQIASGLGSILGITIDPTNTYAYITESFQSRIIQINLQTFARQTIAGSGTNASVDGIGLSAAFSLPWGIIYDPTTALIYNTDNDTGLIRTITTPIYLSTIVGLEVIRTAPTITRTLTISGATVGGLLYNSGGPTASANVIIGKGITLKTDLRAGDYTVTGKTFTASSGIPGGPYGYYYGDGTYVTSISDLRTKEDIRPIRNALSIVRKLQAVEYTKRDDPARRWIGYIAQDIEEVLPQLVTTDDSPEKWKSVQYTNLPGLIIEAIKELKEKYCILFDIANAQSITTANV